MNTIGARIRHEREVQGIDRKELAQRAGIGYSTLAELERGGMQTTTKLRRIADVLRVSQEWLETGKGDKNRPSEHEVARTERPREGYIRFALLDLNASAGIGEVNSQFPEVLDWVDIAEWLVRSYIGFIPKDDHRVRLVTVRGDSMMPNIKHGDVAMVDTGHNFYNGDAVYLIQYDDNTFIKRLQSLPDGLCVISDNKDYLPYKIAPGEDSLHVIGKVLAVLSVKKP